MSENSLNNYLEQFHLTTSISEFRKLVESIALDNGLNEWLKIILSLQDSKELYRDSERGFVLTAYTEKEGQYRIPHNHGHCWVVYAVMTGTMEMGSYEMDVLSDSGVVRKSLSRLYTGDSQVYLKGDIHDTRCLTDKVIVLRLTSCDLKVEEKEGRMKRFPLPISA